MRLTDLQTPALLIRLDRVRANLEHMLGLLGGSPNRWRPHIKTSKVAETFDLLLDAGVRRFKCATTREAAVLLGRTDDPVDLLVAFAHYGPNLERIAELARAHQNHRVSMLTEDADHARSVLAAGSINLFVDLDPGYHRTGIPLAQPDRIHAAIDAAAERLVGLHYYDGHLHKHSPEDRETLCRTIYGEFVEFANALPQTGLELITSGTPTFEQALAFAGFHEVDHTVSPGTIVYSDVKTEQAGVSGFVRATHVLSRVISAPIGGRITCDAGSKAIDAAVGDPCALVEGWPGLTALTPSEEHLPLQVEGEAPAPGSLIELAPMHVCPTVNLADEAVLMEGDEIQKIVPVAARGHETIAR